MEPIEFIKKIELDKYFPKTPTNEEELITMIYIAGIINSLIGNPYLINKKEVNYYKIPLFEEYNFKKEKDKLKIKNLTKEVKKADKKRFDKLKEILYNTENYIQKNHPNINNNEKEELIKEIIETETNFYTIKKELKSKKILKYAYNIAFLEIAKQNKQTLKEIYNEAYNELNDCFQKTINESLPKVKAYITSKIKMDKNALGRYSKGTIDIEILNDSFLTYQYKERIKGDLIIKIKLIMIHELCHAFMELDKDIKKQRIKGIGTLTIAGLLLALISSQALQIAISPAIIYKAIKNKKEFIKYIEGTATFLTRYYIWYGKMKYSPTIIEEIWREDESEEYKEYSEEILTRYVTFIQKTGLSNYPLRRFLFNVSGLDKFKNNNEKEVSIEGLGL